MLSRKNILIQPIIQRQIIRQAAKQAHAHMGVGVDQSRKNEPAPRLDHLTRFVRGVDICAGVDRGDGISLNRDRTILQNAALSVHRDHDAVRHDQIHSLLGQGRRRLEGGRQAANQGPKKPSMTTAHNGAGREAIQVHPQRLTGCGLWHPAEWSARDLVSPLTPLAMFQLTPYVA